MESTDECCVVWRVRTSVVECREYECCGVLRVRTSVLRCRTKRERVCSAVRAKNCQRRTSVAQAVNLPTI